MLLSQRLQRHVNIIFRISCIHLALNDFFHAHLSRGLIPRPQGHANIPVGSYAAYFLLGVHHRQESAIALPHQLRCHSQICSQRNVIRCPHHHFFHFHGALLRTCFCCCS